jgi:hypothetical protein
MSKGSTDSFSGVENISRYASFTLCKFPTAEASSNVILVRLRYLRPGASISRQAPMSFSTVNFKLFKEDGTRSLPKDVGEHESSRVSKIGQPESMIPTELTSTLPMSICSVFNDGKQIAEDCSNSTTISPQRLSTLKVMLPSCTISLFFLSQNLI